MLMFVYCETLLDRLAKSETLWLTDCEALADTLLEGEKLLLSECERDTFEALVEKPVEGENLLSPPQI